MDYKKRIAFFVFFVAILCRFDVATASTVTTVKRRRSIEEKGHVDVCADIIGPSWKKSKHGKGPCETLVTWVPKKTAFTEFVKVNQQSEVEGGFSIAIFCYALHLLPFSVQPIFQPFVNDKGESNGTYDQLLQHIEGKTCEAVAGDVTVRASRTQNIDFTSPYLSSEVYMILPASHEWNQNLWTFFKPFTWRSWIAIVGICICIGLAVAVLEYRVGNPNFTTPHHKRILMVIWFPISTFFFHEGKILNKNAKVVLIMWLCMIFIIIQIYTATLSAWLTLDQMHPKFLSSYANVGYEDGSFLKDFLTQRFNGSGTKIVPLKTVKECKDALSNGTVNVIFHELPYVELFLAKYGSDYMKFGPINQESGIAFAFPRGCPLVASFSRAVINVTESNIMMAMKKKYLGFDNHDGLQPNQAVPQSLDVQSFIGLFIFIGILTIATIISSEISLKRVTNKIPP